MPAGPPTAWVRSFYLSAAAQEPCRRLVTAPKLREFAYGASFRAHLGSLILGPALNPGSPRGAEFGKWREARPFYILGPRGRQKGTAPIRLRRGGQLPFASAIRMRCEAGNRIPRFFCAVWSSLRTAAPS